MLIFDIETEPLPDDELRAMLPPFDPASVKGIVEGEFDPNSVKHGNTTDPAKRAAKTDAARAEHDAAVANAANLIAAAEFAHFEDFKSKAALSATTGRVLCIGYHSPTSRKSFIDAGETFAKHDLPTAEHAILLTFWTRYRGSLEKSRHLAGLNIIDFDVPFLVRRSWILGVDVPSTVFDGRYLCRTFLDLRKHWLCGQHSSSSPSNFDVIGKALGTGGKNGQSGKDFAAMWREDRDAAIAYLMSDLEQPAEWARRMGLVS